MRIPFNVNDLHPIMRGPTQELGERLLDAWLKGETEYYLRPFEGYRSNERQLELLKQKTTKAGAFTSAHWYGLAVDFVPDAATHTGKGRLPDPKLVGARPIWVWPHAKHPDWRVLGEAAASVGLLRQIDWDKPHVEHPAWRQVRAAIRR